MGLLGCTIISPVGRFDVCTYPDCWVHFEREEGVIKTLTRIWALASYMLLLLPLTWLYRSLRTVLRNIYLLSKRREHGPFPPAAAHTLLHYYTTTTVLLLSIGFGQGVIKTLTRIWALASYMLLLLPLTWLYRSLRTVLRNRYLLSKRREHGPFPPAAAHTLLHYYTTTTVLLLSIGFGRSLHRVVVQRLRYIK